jgi:PKD repeat protein
MERSSAAIRAERGRLAAEQPMPACATFASQAVTRAATSVALLLACACGLSAPAGDAPGPVAAGRADREVGPAPLRVCFDATASRSMDGHPLALRWDFGDGAPRSEEPVACHTYAEPASYAASVEVTDLAGRSAQAVVIVTATGP